MQKNKAILLIIVLLVVGAAAVIGYKGGWFTSFTAQPPNVESPTATSTTDTIPDNIAVNSGPTAVEPTLAHQTWLAFQKYRGYAKAHDLAGLRTLSHELSDTCKDSAKRAECNALMDSVYIGTEYLKESDFKTIWSDNKQIIMFGDYKVEGTATSPGVGMFRPIIYFTRAGEQIKLLALNLTDGVLVVDNNRGFEEKRAQLLDMLKDTDEDGLADMTETCSDEDAGEDCIKTNPNKRDTDNDSWWDGIEIFFR